MKSFTKSLTQLSICLLSIVIGVTSTQAQTAEVWTGSGSVNWNDNFNWLDNDAPLNDASTLEFKGTAQTTNNNDFVDFSFGGVNFSNTGDGENFTLQGNRFFLQGTLGISSADVASGSFIENTIANSITIGQESQTLDIGANSTLNLSGVIGETGGSFGLTKSNAGTAVLTMDNTYTGVTNVTGTGRLVVNGNQSAATGDLFVIDTATLGGSGTVGGNIEVASGAFIEAGNSIGTFTTVGDVDLMGTMLVELDGAGAGLSDLLDVGGLFDITAGTVQFSITGAPLDDDAYIFASYGTLNPTIGPFANVISAPSGYTIDYNYMGGNQIALVSAVPEPSALAFLGLCAVGITARRRRRS